MTAPDVASQTFPIVALRLVAVVGAILAIVVVGLAFSRGLLVGLVAVAVAPSVPLTLVVAADRILRR